MILDKIAASTRERVESLKKHIPLTALQKQAEEKETVNGFPFEKALSAPGLSFICEIKKASPSKGIISKDFPYIKTALEYESAGAAAISVLTEPEYFLGNDIYLKEISETVNIPVLRKDFTVDSYQIYEAKLLGASSILLICAILDNAQLEEYIGIAHSLGLSAIVEAHTEDEVRSALKAGARIVGINNRDLRTFDVDLQTTVRLRQFVPDNVIFVSESGIRTPQDIDLLKSINTDAVLIGETLMRTADKTACLKELSGSQNG